MKNLLFSFLFFGVTSFLIWGCVSQSSTIALSSEELLSNFQNPPTEAGGVLGGFVGEQPKYYQDVQVFAYRIQDDEYLLGKLRQNR